MKNLTLFLCLAGLCILVIAARPAKEQSQSFAYCELTVTPRAFSNKVTIAIDFGQEARTFSNDTKLRDEETGKFKRFNSAIDAMNYLGEQGWELTDIYGQGTSGSTESRFVFRVAID